MRYLRQSAQRTTERNFGWKKVIKSGFVTWHTPKALLSRRSMHSHFHIRSSLVPFLKATRYIFLKRLGSFSAWEINRIPDTMGWEVHTDQKRRKKAIPRTAHILTLCGLIWALLSQIRRNYRLENEPTQMGGYLPWNRLPMLSLSDSRRFFAF